MSNYYRFMLEKTKMHNKTKPTCNRRFVATFMPIRRVLAHKSFGFAVVFYTWICTSPAPARVKEPLYMLSWSPIINQLELSSLSHAGQKFPHFPFFNFFKLHRCTFESQFLIHPFIILSVYIFDFNLLAEKNTNPPWIDTNMKWFSLKFKPQNDHLWFLISYFRAIPHMNKIGRGH